MTEPTQTPDGAALRDFIFTQVELWNAGKRTEFLDLYRRTATAGLTLEYVGQQQLAGDAAWQGLAHMWDSYNPQVRLQLVQCFAHGQDAACQFRNLWSATRRHSDGIEVYRLRDGALHARFFH